MITTIILFDAFIAYTDTAYVLLYVLFWASYVFTYVSARLSLNYDPAIFKFHTGGLRTDHIHTIENVNVHT